MFIGVRGHVIVTVAIETDDQVYQYAHCIKDRLRDINMTDIGIYVDVWRSLNGRFQQRLIDPRVDILTAEWSPFQRTKWIMPLLTELTTWRTQLDSLQQNILDDNRQASVAFVADFPGDLTSNTFSWPLNWVTCGRPVPISTSSFAFIGWSCRLIIRNELVIGVHYNTATNTNEMYRFLLNSGLGMDNYIPASVTNATLQVTTQ